MTGEAEATGANAVIGVRFTTSMVMSGAAEIMCYGTGVLSEGGSMIRHLPQRHTALCFLFVLLYAAAAADDIRAQARDNAFVVIVAGDTFAVENVSRSADRIEGEITGQTLGRLVYTAMLGAGGVVSELTLRAWPPGAEPDAAPMQQAHLTVQGDTVVTEVTTAAGVSTHRVATREHAMPYVNLSFGLMDQVVVRARSLSRERDESGLERGFHATASVEVPLFFLQGGQTVAASISWGAADSAVVELGGSRMILELGPDGHIRQATVPAQNLTVTRVDAMHIAPITFVPPDYTAPEGAPYTAEDVIVETPAGHTLAGTLTRPRTTSPVPTVIMISGSGAQDRDQAIPMVRGYRPFREIADTLARRGIAVLRLDDRGFGGSTGDFSTATSADFADDVRSALSYLRSRSDIDGDRLGLIGHSEGGLVAPMVAAADTLLRGIVLIAGPSRTGRSIIEYQQRYAIEQSTAIAPASRDSALAAARQHLEESAARQPWLRFFLDHDPAAVASQVRTPVLILQGATDRQVTADQAEELATAFRAAGNPDVTVHVFPDINHLMLRDADGNPAGYATLAARNIAPEVLGSIVDWVVSRLP